MNITELKALALAASKTIQERSNMNEVALSECNADRMAFRNDAGPMVLELIAQLEDAQGEIRALRATEAGLRERVKELEEGLRLCVHTIELANWGEDFTARNARALLEKKE